MYAILKSYTGMIAIAVTVIALLIVVWFGISMVSSMSAIKVY